MAESLRNSFLWTKAMDPVRSREIATLAMFPRWEGFCKDEGQGDKMTAWEAINTVLDVETCMCKTESMEKNWTEIDVPREYNFGKVTD